MSASLQYALVAAGAVALSGCGGPASSAMPTPEAIQAESETPPPVEIAVPAPEVPSEDVEAPAKPRIVLGTPGWATFQGNAARTGHTDAPEIHRPKIKWRSKVGIQGYLNSPLSVGSLVLVPSSGSAHNKPDPLDGLHALDRASGQAVWHVKSKRDANGAAANERLAVFTSDDGSARAVDLKSGEVLWQAALGERVYSSPLILGEQAYVGDAEGYVHALALADGKVAWKQQFTGAIRGGLASDGRSLYVVSQGGDVAALGFDGKVRWKKAVTRPPFGSRGRPVAIEGYHAPVVDGGRLFVPFARDTTYNVPALVALDTGTGREVWRARGSGGKGNWGNLRSSPMLAHGVLVWAEPYSGDVIGLDARRGTLKFRKEVAPCFFPQYASPAGAGKMAYVPRFGGHVYGFDLPSGALRWEIYLGDSRNAGAGTPGGLRKGSCTWDVPTGWPLYSPAAVAPDGTLLVGSGEGYLYAIVDAG